MDKNNCDNNSYFYERNYYKDVPIKDTQILEYWNNILGKDVIELIDKAYGCKLCLNGMPVPLLRNCYSIFNGTKYR